MNIKIDMLGKPCPIPVIETKRKLRELGEEGGVLEVLVDNDIAVQNLSKMAADLALEISSEEKSEGIFTVFIQVPEQRLQKTNSTKKGMVITIGRNTLGEGDPDLGKLLMKSYIYSLTELDVPPAQILFFNSGAFLTTTGSTALKDLESLVEKGTVIKTCGACLDFYQLQDQLAVGEVTNMYVIVETMNQAEKVINM